MKKKPDFREKTQMDFNFESASKEIQTRMFTLENVVKKKFTCLYNHIENMPMSDIRWLSRIEEFYSEKEYLTDKQMDIVDRFLKKYNLTSSLT